MEEGIAIEYYELLNENSKVNVGVILSRMSNKLLGTVHAKDNIVMFGRLNRMYGRMLIYFILLDLADWNNLDTGSSLYPIITYLAKKKLKELSEKESIIINLNKVSEEIGKEIRRRKKENKRDR